MPEAVDPGMSENPADLARHPAEDQHHRGVQPAIERGGKARLGQGPKVVNHRPGADQKGGDREVAGVPLVVENRGVGRSDQMLPDRENRHPDPPITDRVDAPLSRKQRHHRGFDPRPRIRQHRTRGKGRSATDNRPSRLDALENLDHLRGGVSRIIADVPIVEHRIRADRQRVSRLDPRRLARLDLMAAAIGVSPGSGDAEQSPRHALRRPNRIAGGRGAIKGREIDVGESRLGQNQTNRFGE
jgi:hypothetical protein